ncbi:hypothetical protein CHELA41_40265 [Hyphomicrobiales bacterium]|nr:hypothetical protein CHELA41_40265 [Hyphomicrobiales bacterium]
MAHIIAPPHSATIVSTPHATATSMALWPGSALHSVTWPSELMNLIFGIERLYLRCD